MSISSRRRIPSLFAAQGLLSEAHAHGRVDHLKVLDDEYDPGLLPFITSGTPHPGASWAPKHWLKLIRGRPVNNWN